jgi:hypothetical protein
MTDEAVLFEVRRAIAENDWPWRTAGTIIVVKQLLAIIDGLKGTG